VNRQDLNALRSRYVELLTTKAFTTNDYTLLDRVERAIEAWERADAAALPPSQQEKAPE